MTASLPQLREHLDGFHRLLNEDTLVSASHDERRDLLRSAEDLQEKLEAVEDAFLTVGLLGGTGVGKSSLMNALAGSPISSVSHRRPHTEHVILYRHEEAPPSPPPEALPWKEVLHHADPIRHVLLCDLPDFDSLLTAHRESVLGYLANLDLLIWVSSPEKYADRRMYELLAHVPKARENYLFVLNKADLLKDYDHLTAASTQFTEHLREAGIQTPALFLVSAQEAQEQDALSPWNQFPQLRQQVFQLRNATQVRTIKAENLDVEASRLFARLHRETQTLDHLASALSQGVHHLKQDRPTWERLGRDALTPWLESRAVKNALRPSRDALPLSGPALALSILVLRPTRETDEAEADRWRHLTPPESVVSVLQRQLGWIEDRLLRHLFEERLPSSLKDRIQETLRRNERFDAIGERLFHVASQHTSRSLLPRMIGFRLLQKTTYALLIALLLFALGTPTAWQGLIQAPGWSAGVHLLSSLVRTLFSAQGLAALGSYALLNAFFGLRFVLSYRKRWQRAADRAVRALAQDMTAVWTEQLDAVIEDLTALEQDLRTRSDALASFTGHHPR